MYVCMDKSVVSLIAMCMTKVWPDYTLQAAFLLCSPRWLYLWRPLKKQICLFLKHVLLDAITIGGGDENNNNNNKKQLPDNESQKASKNVRVRKKVYAIGMGS